MKFLETTIYQSYIYVAVLMTSPDVQHSEIAIWLHSLNENRIVGEQELLLDLLSNSIPSSNTINTFRFDESGNLFIRNYAKHLLLINPAGSDNIDDFYKDVLPANCRQFSNGSEDYIYIIATEKC